MDKNDNKNNKVKTQSVSAVTGFVLAEVAKTIIGFIVLWFFRPMWDVLVKWWCKK